MARSRRRNARVVGGVGLVVVCVVFAGCTDAAKRASQSTTAATTSVTTSVTTSTTTPPSSTSAASVVPVAPEPAPLTVFPFGATAVPVSLRYDVSDVQSTPTASKPGQVVLRYHFYLTMDPAGRTGEISAAPLTTDGQLAVELSCRSGSPQCTKIVTPNGPALGSPPIEVVVRTTVVALTEGTHDVVMAARWDDGALDRIVAHFLVNAPPSADISRKVTSSTGPPFLVQTVVGTGNFSYHLTSAFGSVWVVSKGSQTVTRIDAVTGQLLTTIPLPAGQSDRVTATDDAVYASGPKVTRIDPTTNLTSSIDVGGYSLTVFANHKDLWAAGPDGVWHIDAAGTVTKLPLPKAGWLDAGVAGGLVWIVSQSRSKSRLLAIDANTGTIRFDVANIYDPALPNAYPVRLVADERSVVVGIDTGAQHGQVFIVDPATGKITDRVALRARPEGIVLTDRYIWSSGAVIDRATLKVTDLRLGFSLTRGPDGSIWATSGGTGAGVALRYAPGDYTDHAVPTVRSLPALPAVGAAVQTPTGVQLVDLNGAVLATLDGFTLASDWRPDQPVSVQDRGFRFAVDLTANGLRPVSAPPPQTPDDWPKLAPPPPPDPATTVAGHWAWAVPSPDGKTVLAQWSGECEIPQAFFIPAGATPRSVSGTKWTTAPNSFGLGWTPDGRAVVFMTGAAACGTPAPVEGVYLADLNGHAQLLYRGSEAQLWQR